MHATNKLYHGLQSPTENVTMLASAMSDHTNEHEPLLMTIEYGKSRVFHTALGHSVESLQGLGFQLTFAHGTEWAATRRVTLPTPPSGKLAVDKAATRPIAP